MAFNRDRDDDLDSLVPRDQPQEAPLMRIPGTTINVTARPPENIRTISGAPALGLVMPNPRQVPPAEAPSISSTAMGQMPTLRDISEGQRDWPSVPDSRRPPVMGKVGNILKDIAIAAGSTMAPQVMPFIPGTPQYKDATTRRVEGKERFGMEKEESAAKVALERAEAEKALRGETAEEHDVVKAYSNALATGNTAEAERLAPLVKQYEEAIEKKSATGKSQLLTDAEGNVLRVPEEGPATPLMRAGGTMPPVPLGQESVLGVPAEVPAAPLAAEPVKAAQKPERPATDVNESIANYFRLKGWNPDPNSADYARHWQQAHQAYTTETKTEPGVVRVEALGETRGMPVTDTQTGVTAPMSWNDYNRLSRANPGRYSSPAFDEVVQAGITGARGLAPKNTGQQVQSYGTFIRHTGDLYNAIDSLKNTNAPLMNRPLNWLRTNTGQPEVKAFLAKWEPVKKEFGSFLVNNRALYEEDREAANKILDENASPAQMYAVLPSLVNTGTARLEEANAAYRRATGKDIPNLVTPEAASVFKQMKLSPPRATAAEATGEPAVGTVEGGYRYKGGGAHNKANWEKVTQ